MVNVLLDSLTPSYHHVMSEQELLDSLQKVFLYILLALHAIGQSVVPLHPDHKAYGALS